MIWRSLLDFWNTCKPHRWPYDIISNFGMSALRTVSTSWALWPEWRRLGCINYFGNKTSYSAGTCKIKRWKVTLRCMEVTLLLQASSFGFCTSHLRLSFMTWRQGTSKEKSDSSDLDYTLNMSTDVSGRNTELIGLRLLSANKFQVV